MHFLIVRCEAPNPMLACELHASAMAQPPAGAFRTSSCKASRRRPWSRSLAANTLPKVCASARALSSSASSSTILDCSPAALVLRAISAASICCSCSSARRSSPACSSHIWSGLVWGSAFWQCCAIADQVHFKRHIVLCASLRDALPNMARRRTRCASLRIACSSLRLAVSSACSCSMAT